MSNAILVLGESGTGKSTSLRNLNPKETFIINSVGKELPFRGWRNKYTEMKGGNYSESDNSISICRLIDNISTSRPDVKNLVIDDFQFIMSNEYMRRAKETGYGKFTDIGLNAFNIITKATQVRKDLNVFILAHSIKDNEGFSKLQTVGKMVDEKVKLEGRVTIVLHTFVDPSLPMDQRYKFLTQTNGFCMAKSPMGMFDNLLIDNDLKYVCDKVNNYYDNDIDTDNLDKSPKEEQQ